MSINIKSVQVRDITGKTHKRITEDMPAKPYLGQQFVPDGTDSVGTIVNITKGKHGPEVEYTFDTIDDAYNPQPGITTYTRSYSEVRKMGWAA